MENKNILRTVFIALVIDLLAFTLILPLLPTLIEEYRAQKSASLTALLDFLNTFKRAVHRQGKINPKWDTVLLGGLLGSLFSLLQSIASPRIGKYSDKHGRRKALLLTMIGNIAATLIWMNATTFPLFVLSRIVGGLSEGNVQLSLAIASDISSKANRSSHLAVVGIAFSLAFTFGPLIGAVSQSYLKSQGAATVALTLLVVETTYLYVALPETKPNTTVARSSKQSKKADVEDNSTLTRLSIFHFLFLLFFSGLEFSLTFLTFDVFGFGPAQNGRLLGFLGLLGSGIQGGITRRTKSEKGLALAGICSCVLAYIFLARVETVGGLYAASALLGITSATVVTCLTSLASKAAKEHSRGQQMGNFRSAGQVGRALGPIFSCCAYWWFGREIAYSVGGVAMFIVMAGFVATT